MKQDTMKMRWALWAEINRRDKCVDWYGEVVEVEKMSSECCVEKPASLIALANNLREAQDETSNALEEVLGPQPVSESANEKPCGNLDELRILLVGMLRNAKDILGQVNRINSII